MQTMVLNTVVATVHGLATSGNLSISLLAPNSPEAPAYPSGNWNLNGLPVLNIRSLWDVTTTFASTSYDLASATMIPRPLPRAPQSASWSTPARAWSLVPNTTLNTSTDLIAATGLQSVILRRRHLRDDLPVQRDQRRLGQSFELVARGPAHERCAVQPFQQPHGHPLNSQSFRGVGLWGTGTLTVNNNGGSLTIANPLTVTAGHTLDRHGHD